MKKILLSVVIVLSLSLLLASCEIVESFIPPKDADTLYERINEKMESANSYKASISMDLETEINGGKMTGKFTGDLIVSGEVSGDYYFYESTHTKINMPDFDVIETDSLTAYSNGKIYISNEDDDFTQRLCSPATGEEFEDYRSDEEDYGINDFDEATNKEFYKNEDSTWTLKYSDYDSADIREFSEKIHIKDIVDNDVKDMNVIITADKSYYVTEVLIEFVFEKGENDENLPKLSMAIKYSDFDAAECIAIDDTQFTAVDDVRILKTIDKTLEELEDDKDGSIRLDTLYEVKVKGTVTTSNKEIDVIKYGETDGKFFYDIDATINNTWADLSYSDGKLTVRSASGTSNRSQSDNEARETISTLINGVNYSSMKVTDVKRQDDGAYELTLDIDKDTYTSMLGLEVVDISHTIRIEYVDGEINRMESTIDITTIYDYKIILQTALLLDYVEEK